MHIVVLVLQKQVWFRYLSALFWTCRTFTKYVSDVAIRFNYAICLPLQQDNTITAIIIFTLACCCTLRPTTNICATLLKPIPVPLYFSELVTNTAVLMPVLADFIVFNTAMLGINSSSFSLWRQSIATCLAGRMARRCVGMACRTQLPSGLELQGSGSTPPAWTRRLELLFLRLLHDYAQPTSTEPQYINLNKISFHWYLCMMNIVNNENIFTMAGTSS